MLARCWRDAGAMLARCWRDAGAMLAQCWRNAGAMLAQCWRNARDTGQSVQPCLYKILASHNCEMLAPVFDSLIHLCEDALRRPVAVGDAAALSSDEHLLLGLLDGSKLRHACIDCAEGTASALDCAICSTRIMMGLAFGHVGYVSGRIIPTQSVPPVMH